MPKPQNLAAYKLTPEKLQLVIKNLSLVRKVINDRFSVYHEWYEDMLQEGTIGLIKAVAKHDDSRGAQLSTFAYFCIKNEIQKFVSECTDTIRVPVSVGLAINGVRLVEQAGGTEEDKQDVLKHNQISKEMLEAGKRALATVSMDEETSDGLPYRDIIPGKPLTLSNAVTAERQMYSDIHHWFNFNYPEELLNNRLYINYIYMTDQGCYKSLEIYKELCTRYLVTRNYIRELIPRYNERLRTYLRNAKN